MNRYIFLIWSFFLVLSLIGCGQREETLEEIQEPLSIEVSGMPTTSGKISEIPLPPQGPYRPTNRQIQTALKNAGYYTAKIDGRVGPLTKKAIKEFQAANNLKADGKVGPKTWTVLSSYLSAQTLEPGLE